MEKFKVQLTLTGTGQFGSLPIPTPLSKVMVEAEDVTFVGAVNRAVHKLSNLLSKQEG